ncbi:hypothetical protein ACFL41_02620 [Gemmatimonadota bacterium]
MNSYTLQAPAFLTVEHWIVLDLQVKKKRSIFFTVAAGFSYTRFFLFIFLLPP